MPLCGKNGETHMYVQQYMSFYAKAPCREDIYGMEAEIIKLDSHLDLAIIINMTTSCIGGTLMVVLIVHEDNYSFRKLVYKQQ